MVTDDSRPAESYAYPNAPSEATPPSAVCEKAAEPTKSGKPRKDYGYDDVTKIIGADKNMSKDDRRTILAMKDILEGKNSEEKGKEE